MNKTIAQIKEELILINNKEASLLQELALDPRSGVQKLLQQKYRQLDQLAQLQADHQARLQIETDLHQAGYRLIAGIDEVGRGPLAGPVVTCAVILPQDTTAFVGINDSKQVSAKKRASFAEIIRQEALAYSISVYSVDQIDQLNILEATKQSMVEAVAGLSIQPDYLLIDALEIPSALPQAAIIKGDQRSLSIAAASILAKEHRDQMMVEYAQSYPQYRWDKNMGYGTKEHLQALDQYGYTPLHRKSFEPIKSMTQKYQEK
ncbi:ribonuclease HII [Hutsoniella sourekii]|uniref:ribonuclease HII n=1 Tax=Hutsoniella sourekii TaxID=87650 RepID=UPI000488AC5A|nr:ribonuclease HII [Hutsoniella sourekii]